LGKSYIDGRAKENHLNYTNHLTKILSSLSKAQSLTVQDPDYGDGNDDGGGVGGNEHGARNYY
jgi:hypothetical protein